MKPIRECKYSAFISYAHDDDVLLGGWIRKFRTELERGVAVRVRDANLRLPPMHLSQENGPVAGFLGEELRERLAESFAMVIVVHDVYARSTWCLKELEFFKDMFGEEGLRERLFILALSQDPIDRVTASDAWQRLMPGGEQLWTGFFPNLQGNMNEPAPILLDSGMPSQLFTQRFNLVRDEFAGRVKASLAARAAAPPPRAMPQPRPAAPAAPAAPAEASAIAFGCVPGLEAAAGQVADRLRAMKLDVRQLALTDDPGRLSQARLLVLPFDEQPVSFLVLAQVDQWLRLGRSPESIRWLDLRATPGAQPLPPGAAPAGQRALAADALCDELRPAEEPAAALADNGVTIYIESNQNERNLWKPLGRHLSRKWEEYLQQHAPGSRPPLRLMSRGLPVDDIDRFPLADADGVVLLWGKKTPDALVAQINKVENKLPGRDGAPSIVAFLMPPQQSAEPVPAWGWQVLRVDAKDDTNIGVLDEVDLRDFFQQVHEFGTRRCAAAA